MFYLLTYLCHDCNASEVYAIVIDIWLSCLHTTLICPLMLNYLLGMYVHARGSLNTGNTANVYFCIFSVYCF